MNGNNKEPRAPHFIFPPYPFRCACAYRHVIALSHSFPKGIYGVLSARAKILFPKKSIGLFILSQRSLVKRKLYHESAKGEEDETV